MRNCSFMFCYERAILFKLANNFNNISKFTSYRTKTHCIFIINANYTTSFGECLFVDSEKHKKSKVRFFSSRYESRWFVGGSRDASFFKSFT